MTTPATRCPAVRPAIRAPVEAAVQAAQAEARAAPAEARVAPAARTPSTAATTRRPPTPSVQTDIARRRRLDGELDAAGGDAHGVDAPAGHDDDWLRAHTQGAHRRQQR